MNRRRIAALLREAALVALREVFLALVLGSAAAWWIERLWGRP